LNSLSEKDRKAEQEGIQRLGEMASVVLQADDPAKAYTDLRSQLPPEIAKTMPDTYDQNYMRMLLARAVTADRMIARQPKVKPPEAPKTADASFFAREAARAFGGILGPDGTITGLSKDDSAKAAALAAEASRIYRSSEGITQNEAVAMALKKLYGGTAPDSGPPPVPPGFE
ncbi:MAG: hypothetical protein D6773_06360, partial [Alphaproteobacteria bacterium]